MKRNSKTIYGAILILILIVGTIGTAAVYIITHLVKKNVVTDIGSYEAYFGAQGIHRTKNTEAWKKTRESYLVISDIFPEKLPDSAEAEDFYYEYYNPWDPCYLGYLVYSCDEEDYQAESARLQQIPMPENYLIYGATDFPYPLLAVNVSDYGYIYAMADETQKKIIYVELTFCNYFTDIDYESVIPKEYLPAGFDAKQGNFARQEFEAKNKKPVSEESVPADHTAGGETEDSGDSDVREKNNV